MAARERDQGRRPEAELAIDTRVAPNREFKLVVDQAEALRLDQFLTNVLPMFSRSRLQSLIRQGCVQVGDEAVLKPGQRIEPGEVVVLRVPPAAPSAHLPESIPLEIVFEDKDVLIVDKPAGLVVHPGAGHAGGTLVNAALAHDPTMRGVGGQERPGVVHRLDKDTSGLIILAKNDAALHWLQHQFETRQVQKTYLALVDGRPPTPTGRIEAAIGRNPSQRKQMAVRSRGQGRPATSMYSTRESFRWHTLLEVQPVTGRTHQVRVHCAFLGCPVAGDTVYGRKRPSIEIGRHFLHAWKLQLALPSDPQRREFIAPLPEELEVVLAMLRAENPPSG